MDDTDTKQLKGTVTTWFDQKGYGWVTRDDGDLIVRLLPIGDDYLACSPFTLGKMLGDVEAYHRTLRG